MKNHHLTDFKDQKITLGGSKHHDEHHEHHHEHHDVPGDARDQHHEHHHEPHVHASLASQRPLLVIRPHSGVSGDILVAGLAALAGADQSLFDEFLGKLGLKTLQGRVKLEKRSVNGIGGLALAADIPHEHSHRTMSDVRAFFESADITEGAKNLAIKAFTMLAAAEGLVHDRPADSVTFHEVGALDSLMDIGLASIFFDRLNFSQLICGPLPLSDGQINCAHGILPSPAPAVSILLEGVTVRGFPGEGETVTPTGLSLLKSFGAIFGPWPNLTIEKQALIYGSKVFSNAPNGCLFALGPKASSIPLTSN